MKNYRQSTAPLERVLLRVGGEAARQKRAVQGVRIGHRPPKDLVVAASECSVSNDVERCNEMFVR